MTTWDSYGEQLTKSIIQSFELLEMKLQEDGCWELFNEPDSGSGSYFYSLSVPTLQHSNAAIVDITDIRVYKNRITATARLPFSVNGLVAKQLLMYTANEAFGKCIKSHDISFPLTIDYELSDGRDLVTLEYEPDNETENVVLSVPMKMKKEVENGNSVFI